MLALFQALIAALTPPVLKPDPLNATPGKHRVVAVRDGYRLQELPVGQGERPRRSHAFEDIPSYAAWLLRHAKAETSEIFAGPPGRSESFPGGVIQTLTDNAWISDTATCRLTLDPGFARLRGYLGKAYSQADMLAILRPIRARLGASGETMIGALATLQIKAGAEVVQVIDPRSGSLKSKFTSNNIEHSIPAEVTYSGPVYLQGQERTIVLTLLVDFDGQKQPRFVLQWPEQELALTEGFFAEVDALRISLGDEWLVSLGLPGVEALRDARHNEEPERKATVVNNHAAPAARY